MDLATSEEDVLELLASRFGVPMDTWSGAESDSESGLVSLLEDPEDDVSSLSECSEKVVELESELSDVP